MIFQLFRIRKTYRDIKEAKNDPRGFAEGQLKETALGAILAPLVPMLVVVVLCFVFGYIVGDGSGFFRVVFWIFFIPFTIFLASMWALYRGMKKLTKNIARKTHSDTIHVEARDIAS
jgi:hypothetical protein